MNNMGRLVQNEPLISPFHCVACQCAADDNKEIDDFGFDQ